MARQVTQVDAANQEQTGKCGRNFGECANPKRENTRSITGASVRRSTSLVHGPAAYTVISRDRP
jgi:hypothetical protein